MGWSIKKPFKVKVKAPKAVSKIVNKVTAAVGKPVETIVNGAGKIATGNFTEGVGDITGTLAKNGLNIVTVGNADKVNELSGGGVDTLVGAARGNSKDIVRTGATGAATFFGGPAVGLAVNQGFAMGGAQGGVASLLGSFGVPPEAIAAVTSFIKPPKAAVEEVFGFAEGDSQGAGSAPGNQNLIIALGLVAAVLVLVAANKKR